MDVCHFIKANCKCSLTANSFCNKYKIYRMLNQTLSAPPLFIIFLCAALFDSGIFADYLYTYIHSSNRECGIWRNSTVTLRRPHACHCSFLSHLISRLLSFTISIDCTKMTSRSREKSIDQHISELIVTNGSTVFAGINTTNNNNTYNGWYSLP